MQSGQKLIRSRHARCLCGQARRRR
jgi:hypothetical protein